MTLWSFAAASWQSPRTMLDVPKFDATLLRCHDRPGPRYTSYPSAPQFTPDFGASDLIEYSHLSNASAVRRPLSLYLHIPFCFSPCFYCGCNRLISRDVARGTQYAERLLCEIERMALLFDGARQVVQLHLGGGTPNFLSAETLARLMRRLGRCFRLSTAHERDFSIELDPRSVPPDYVPALAQLGINRVSLGVQDFDPEVQRAVNRLQSVEQTFDLIDECRDRGIGSVNIDLIYGLPRQTLKGFQQTLRMVMSARPDRVAVYGYAHLPNLFKAQRRIEATALPSPEVRFDLLRLAIEELSASGYRYIGMDHFALPGDELVQAQEADELQRNFMGYTTHAHCDLIGMGVSAISHIGDSFSQNFRDLKAWEGAVDGGRMPLWRGKTLSADDCVRGAVIGQLMCQGRIDTALIEQRHHIDFEAYFHDALEQLKPHVADGLVRVEAGRIAVTATGRLLLRSIAMCFDAYLSAPRASSDPPSFSKLV
jgi:oxygen-independent coproporphyrinogen III oxidase